MARRDALRTLTKVTDPCPRCGSRRPKDLAEKRQEIHGGCLFLLTVLFTCGLGVFLYPLFVSPARMEAYCTACDTAFPVSGWPTI